MWVFVFLSRRHHHRLWNRGQLLTDRIIHTCSFLLFLTQGVTTDYHCIDSYMQLSYCNLCAGRADSPCLPNCIHVIESCLVNISMIDDVWRTFIGRGSKLENLESRWTFRCHGARRIFQWDREGSLVDWPVDLRCCDDVSEFGWCAKQRGMWLDEPLLLVSNRCL